jgi:hypothetical protein
LVTSSTEEEDGAFLSSISSSFKSFKTGFGRLNLSRTAVVLGASVVQERSKRERRELQLQLQSCCYLPINSKLKLS